MWLQRLGAIAVVGVLAIASLPQSPSAQLAPAGFVVENAFPAATFSSPVDIAFLPDGRLLLAEQRGVVWMLLADGTQLAAPFIDLSDEVLCGAGAAAAGQEDFGLLGLGVDPDFTTNRWVYFAYTVDPDGDGADDQNYGFSRVTRYQSSLADSNVADPVSRQVLIGETWSSGLPQPGPAHTIGALEFGDDKTLLIASGDAAHAAGVDSGGLHPFAFGAGLTDPAQDMGAFRAASLNSLSGKILRVDKETGHGLDSNPYWDGDSTSDRSRVWIYGCRNPIRFSVRRGSGNADPAAGDPGTIYVADVGWAMYEELDIVEQGGANLGWPCKEGPVSDALYQAISATASGNTNVLCDAPASPENPVEPTQPDLWWHHYDAGESNPFGWTGVTGIGGTFYSGTMYPPQYRDRYYVADWGEGWIRAIEVNAADSVLGWSEFVSLGSGPLDLETDPASGDIFYVAFNSEEVWRIRYVGTGVGDPIPIPGIESVTTRPNPFRAHTTIDFQLGAAATVSLTIHDPSGRLVRRIDRRFDAGAQSVVWDGRGEGGRALASGAYLYRVSTDAATKTGRLVRLR